MIFQSQAQIKAERGNVPYLKENLLNPNKMKRLLTEILRQQWTNQKSDYTRIWVIPSAEFMQQTLKWLRENKPKEETFINFPLIRIFLKSDSLGLLWYTIYDPTK